MTEIKITMNLMQARKIAEYASIAHWHAKRKSFVIAEDNVDHAKDVLLGVKLEDPDTPVGVLHETMVNFKGRTVDEYVLLHDAAVRVLAHVELSHYVPQGSGARVE